jgi:hypothetical protein
MFVQTQDFHEHEKCDFSCEIVTSDGLREATRLNEFFMYLPQPAPSTMRGKPGTPSEQALETAVEPIMILRTTVGAYQNLYIAKIVEIAAEQRQRIAHGVSRGNRAKKSSSPGCGERKRLWRALSPLRGSFPLIRSIPRLTPWAAI